MADPLLHLVAIGNQQALITLQDRYRGLVWSLVRRFCFDPAEAEDAMQEIFVDLWRSSHRFDPAVASEATFVAMIARRRLIDRRRRANRGPVTTVLNESISAQAPVERPSRNELSEQLQAAQAALTQLRPAQQEVLRLSLYQGLSHERIAEAMGLPLGTVKTHVRRGLMRIREILAANPATPSPSSDSELKPPQKLNSAGPT